MDMQLYLLATRVSQFVLIEGSLLISWNNIAGLYHVIFVKISISIIMNILYHFHIHMLVRTLKFQQLSLVKLALLC